MKYSVIIPFIQKCTLASTPLINWVEDESRFNDENADGCAPGGILNRFGYYVIGTTIGGHAIVVSDKDPRVLFADYTWYDEEEIDFQDLSGDGGWHVLPLTGTNVRKSLYELASSKDEFLMKLQNGDIDRLLDPIA